MGMNFECILLLGFIFYNKREHDYRNGIANRYSMGGPSMNSVIIAPSAR